MDIKLLTHLIYRFKAKPSGLLPTPKDKRDFKTKTLGWSLFGYTPKYQSHIIPTLSIKSQDYNDCQWNATTVQKEPDEAMLLSVGSIVSYGKKNGMVSQDGFSNLRDGQKCLKDWGIVAEDLVSPIHGDFNTFSSLDTVKFANEAAKHKISSYWSVSSRNDILKLLDEDRILTTGIDWFTAFNQGGGFASPWIITKKSGYYVGGHAIAIIGYNLNYHGKQVYIMQNSYGEGWGDKGKFYIEMSYLEANNYGIYTNLDIAVDTAKFINDYDGKNVKTIDSNTIWAMQQGKRKAYPDEDTYWAYNASDPMIMSYELVDKETLMKVPQGDNMDITKSLYWDYLKNYQGKEERIQALMEILRKK